MKTYVDIGWKKMEKNIVKEFLDAGKKAYYGEVKVGQVLVVPPGFLAAVATEDEAVCGLRKSFLTADAGTKASFETLIEGGVSALTPFKELVASKVAAA